MITVIWDTWLKLGTEQEGLPLTRKYGLTCASLMSMSPIRFLLTKMPPATSSLSPMAKP
jgi:hypothetical protein